jgi:hypothetical protein
MSTKFMFRQFKGMSQIEQDNWRELGKELGKMQGKIDSINTSAVSLLSDIRYNFVASTALGGHRIVYKNSISQVAYASNNDNAQASLVIGITTEAVSSGANVSVLIFGEFEEFTWSWLTDRPIFLGLNGLMTQTVPTSGYVLQVAAPITPTKILVDIRTPVLL